METIPRDGVEVLVLLARHWRLLAVATLFQIIGGGVSLFALQPLADPLLDFWIGAAVAGPIGFMLGLAWHLSNRRRRQATHWPLVVFLILGALATAALGWPK